MVSRISIIILAVVALSFGGNALVLQRASRAACPIVETKPDFDYRPVSLLFRVKIVMAIDVTLFFIAVRRSLV